MKVPRCAARSLPPLRRRRIDRVSGFQRGPVADPRQAVRRSVDGRFLAPNSIRCPARRDVAGSTLSVGDERDEQASERRQTGDRLIAAVTR